MSTSPLVEYTTLNNRDWITPIVTQLKLCYLICKVIYIAYIYFWTYLLDSLKWLIPLLITEQITNIRYIHHMNALCSC